MVSAAAAELAARQAAREATVREAAAAKREKEATIKQEHAASIMSEVGLERIVPLLATIN